MGYDFDCAVVTGASGFIGQALMRFLADRNVSVYGIVRHADDARLFRSERVVYIPCPMDAYDTLPMLLAGRERRPKVFYHLAWDGTAGKARADYVRQCSNARATCDAMVTAKAIGCQRFIATGTVTEFIADDMLKRQYTSENLMYGLAKSFTHKLLDIVARQQDVDYIWAQLSNIYGGHNASGNLISYTLGELRRGNRPTYGPCEQPYNFTYIEDVLEALFLLGGVSVHRQATYFISNGECRKLKEYLLSLADRFHAEVGIGERPDDGVRYSAAWFDSSALQEEFGFVPQYRFEDGLKEILGDEHEI
jgi:nucleoside-diphosphate-sugar epimerase